MTKRKTRLTGNTHRDGDQFGPLFKIAFVIFGILAFMWSVGTEHQFRSREDYRRVYSADVAPCSTPEDAKQCERLQVPLNIEDAHSTGDVETSVEATL